MKAIRIHEFGDPEVMKLEDVPDPIPGSDQVLVRVHAAGVNPVDAYIRSGIYGQIPMPYTPGIDGAGTVEAVGDGVSGVKIGDRVYFGGTLIGAYAEKAVCSIDQVHLLPEKLSFRQGAAIGVPYATAYHALFQRVYAQPGEVILVHGASGGVGIAALQLARVAGMTVIGTASTGDGCRLVVKQGAHHVLNHREPEHFQQALDLTGGRGVDVILEMMANVNLGQDIGILAKHGRVIVIGSRGPVEINPRNLMEREADIRGMLLMSSTDQERRMWYAAINAGLENGTLNPIIGQEFPLTEAARAPHREIMESTALGKRILVV